MSQHQEPLKREIQSTCNSLMSIDVITISVFMIPHECMWLPVICGTFDRLHICKYIASVLGDWGGSKTVTSTTVRQ